MITDSLSETRVTAGLPPLLNGIGPMTEVALNLIREWDAKCGDNETTFFPVTKDRRRLLEHVDELRELLRLCRDNLERADTLWLGERINSVLGR
jgi:hypothetical protein